MEEFRIIELESVDSTNTYAARLLDSDQAEHGTVIYAHEQYAGRGQHENRWESAPRMNLTFTLILKPDFLPAEHQFQLNKAVTRAIIDYVQDFLGRQARFFPTEAAKINSWQPTVKWPNDIYLNNSKLGGILIEHRIVGDRIGATIAGIGINVNQRSFSPDLPNPVSLATATGHEVSDLHQELALLCRLLEKRYQKLAGSGLNSPDDDWNQCLLGFAQWREFLREGNVFEGMITGTDSAGQLLIRDRSGRLHTFAHREVEYVL